MTTTHFTNGFFTTLDYEISSGISEVQNWIDAQVHGAAVQLLNSVMPPIIHANNSAVRISEFTILTSASTRIGFTLNTADLGNTTLSGAVANTVQRGLNEVKSEGDYVKGVNSVTW